MEDGHDSGCTAQPVDEPQGLGHRSDRGGWPRSRRVACPCQLPALARLLQEEDQQTRSAAQTALRELRRQSADVSAFLKPLTPRDASALLTAVLARHGVPGMAGAITWRQVKARLISRCSHATCVMTRFAPRSFRAA